MLLCTPLSTLTLCMLLCCKMRCLGILCPRSICKSFAKAYASSTRTECVHSFPILRQANLRSSLCMYTANSSLYPFSKNSWNWMHSKELYWFLHLAHHILGHGRTVLEQPTQDVLVPFANPKVFLAICKLYALYEARLLRFLQVVFSPGPGLVTLCCLTSTL